MCWGLHVAPTIVVDNLPVAVCVVQLSAAALVMWYWRVHLALAQGPLSAHEGGGPAHLEKESLSGGQSSGEGDHLSKLNLKFGGRASDRTGGGILVLWASSC